MTSVNSQHDFIYQSKSNQAEYCKQADCMLGGLQSFKKPECTNALFKLKKNTN